MHVQQAVHGFDRFVRCIGFGPQTHCVLYDPAAPLHERYTTETNFISKEEEAHLRKITLTINAFFDWEFNSCEALRRDGRLVPDRLREPVPRLAGDVAALALPVDGEGLPPLVDLLRGDEAQDAQEPGLGAVHRDRGTDLPFEEKLDRYAKIADERFDTARFDEFCAKHLSHLDEVAWNFFGTAPAKEAVRQKVGALFPAHEHEKFTEHFWDRIQQWRKSEEPGAKRA